MEIQLQSKRKIDGLQKEKGRKGYPMMNSRTDGNLLEMEKAIALIFNKAFQEGNKVKGFLEIVEDIQALLEAIIHGDVNKAEKYVMKFASFEGKDLFAEVGKITRKLHDSIKEFQDNITPRLKNLHVVDLPEASDKLQWVITRTEEAASRTINLVEKHLGCQENTTKIINQLENILREKGVLKDMTLKNFDYFKEMNQELPKDLMEILIAQDFQDLTGQIIKKVILLISDIEKQLIKILKMFGVKSESGSKPEDLQGPQIKKHEEVVSDQSEVDDILNQFGF